MEEKTRYVTPSSEIREKPCSCEIAQNAKGDVSFVVKAYGETLEEAREAAQAEYEKVREYLRQKPAPAVA